MESVWFFMSAQHHKNNLLNATSLGINCSSIAQNLNEHFVCL
jgi:hypothetical protein